MSDPPFKPEDNVDPSEIARFARIANEWWAPDGKFKALHALTPTRMDFIRDTALEHFGSRSDAAGHPNLRPLRGLRAVDVGCGGGLASEPLCRLGADVTGIDLAEESIAAAKSHAAAGGLDIAYRAVSAETLIEEQATFDLVVCLEVIEHVPDPGQFVATCSKLVVPGGLVVLSTINRTRRAYLLAIVAGEYVLGWLERGTHDWDRFVTPSELAGYLEDAGLRARGPKGTVYNPLAARWELSSDVSVNYMIAAARSG